MRKPSTTTLLRTEKLRDRQLTIGLDLGDRSSFYCVLNGAGEVILEAKVERLQLRSLGFDHFHLFFFLNAMTPEQIRQILRES